MKLTPLLFGVLAFVSLAMAFFYAALNPGAPGPDPKWAMFLGAAFAAIGTVLGVRRKRAGRQQKRLQVVGLAISLVALGLIVGLVLLYIYLVIGFDKHHYARTPGSVQSYGLISGPYEARVELHFRTLDWSCRPNEGDGQNLGGPGPGYVCRLDFEASVSRYGDNIDYSSSIPPDQWPTVDSLDQGVIDRCYRPSQGGPFRRSEGCSSPQHSYSGYADREREYEAWDLVYRAEGGTCFDRPVSPGTSVVCQSLFRVQELPDFVVWQWDENTGAEPGSFLPGVEVTPPTTTLR